MSERLQSAPTAQPVDFDPFDQSNRALPLTESQREMYAVAQMGDAASCAYNQCFALRLRGPLSPESLRSALREVIRRHEALRVSIDREGEYQTVHSAVDVELSLLDLSGHDAEARAQIIRDVLDRETRAPFDLSVAPLWRAQLLRESVELHHFVFTAHHIVVDGWSSAVLFGDLSAAYVADRFGLPVQLAPPASYSAFVADERSASSRAQTKADEEFWVAQFANGVPRFELPVDRMRPRFKTYAGARCTKVIDNALYEAVRKLGAQHGATLFVTLLAAFEVLVSSLSDTESFVVGIPMASQPLRENVRLVAHGVNTIPLKCSVSPKQSFIDHLRSVRQAFLDAQAHQRLTFGSLIRALKLPRDPSRTTLISVIFNIDRIGSPFDFGELKIERIETPKAFCNFELSINAIDDGECLLLECDYNVDLFDAETIQRWLDAYETMLRSAIRGDALTSQLDFSPSDAERPLRSLHPMRTIVAPRTATESMVVEVFASVLNRSDVGALDDFFDLGGHSLMAARVMAKLRAAAGVDLALRNLFERSTPEALAAAIDAMSWTAASRENNRNSSDREEVDL